VTVPSEPLPGHAPKRATRVLALVATLLGAAVIAGAFLSQEGVPGTTTPASGRWSGEPLYLQSTIPLATRTCLVVPDAGVPRSVPVGPAPHRGSGLTGLTLEPWFRGAATITCPDGIVATRGPVVLLAPLGELDGWVVVPAAFLMAIGLVHGRSHRHRPDLGE
jgi:hypothetical protein